MTIPVVTANFTRLALGETIALSSMFDFSDADGDPIAEVIVTDFNIGVGQFFINGVAQLQGVPLTVSAEDLPFTFYSAGFITGGESFSVSASDGSDFSPVSTNVIRVGNVAPTVRAIPSVVPLGSQIPFFSMIEVTDIENDPILEFRVRDNGANPNSGSFFLDGNLLAPNVFHDLTPAEASRLFYRAGNVSNFSESFSVTVDDGIRSPISANNVTTGNSSPVITPILSQLNVLEQTNRSFSDFVNITDADNDNIVTYFVVDRSSNPNTGFLELNGVALPSATFNSLSPAQFANLDYVGADNGPTSESIGIQVFDGFSLSETVDFRVNTTAPVVIQPTNQTSVLPNESVLASSLFNAFDPDGGEVLSYFFVDRRPNANGGFFTLNGVRQPSAQFFPVSAAELPNLRYVGASFGPDSEFIGIQARDSDGFTVAVDIPILTDTRPVAFGTDTSLLEAFTIDVAPLVSGTDSVGNSPDFYRLTDLRSNVNGGFFQLEGTRLPSGQFIQVTPAQLQNLEYVGGAFGEQSENIRLQVSIGGVLSNPTFFEITTLENQFRPEVTAFDINARVGTSVDVASIFSFTDADGPQSNFTEARFFDTGQEADSGFFSVNGVRQPAREFFTVTADQIASGVVRYNVSNRSDSELYRVTVNDGRFVSVLDTGQIQAVASPVLAATQNDFSVDTLEDVLLSDFVSQTDSGPFIDQFQILDENTDDRSGRIQLDGVDLQQGIVHTLTAAQFERVVLQGAEADFGRQLDGFIVRGTNSVGLTSEWTRFNVTTDPVGADALTTGLQIANTSGGPITEITYTFIDSGGQTAGGTRAVPQRPLLPGYYPDGQNCVGGAVVPGVEALGTLAWNQPQREEARRVFESIQQYANIEFTEVPYDGTASDAQITLGSWGPHDCGGDAYGYLPFDFSGEGTFSSDIWFDWNVPGWDSRNFDINGPTTVQGEGTTFTRFLLQSIGTTLGLGAANSLSIFNNFDYNTVQSNQHFNGNSQFDEAFPEEVSSFQLYDIVELQRLYGERTDFNTENNQYRFTDAHQIAIYDSAGIDTLNLTTNQVDTIIDLREGQRSTLEDRTIDANGDEVFTAFANSVLIPYGVTIENARSGSGNDTVGGNEITNLLITNAGEDTLIGRGGNDVLRGGDDADTYIWNLGDGRDTIIDVDINVAALPFNRERDRIEIVVETGELDSLEDDLLFRRLGNTLRIDLNLNRAEAQGSIVVQNFDQLANQVETLALFGPPATQGGDNVQIGEDIDLVSIFEQSGTLGQRFQTTSIPGNFGNIAVPV